MPLSGPHGEQGKKLAEIIKYGIEDKIQGFINITTLDVATEDYTRQAIEKMIASRTEIILGPIFTPSVKSLENYVKSHNVLMFTLSNNPILAEPKQIYVAGHAPLKQSSVMINYLASLGNVEFALLLPKNKTSANLENVLKEMISSKGANMFKSVKYENSKESIREAIATLDKAIEANQEGYHVENKPVIFIAEDNPDSIKLIFDELSLLKLDSKAIIAGDNRIDIAYNGNIKFLFTGSKIVPSNSLLQKTKLNLGISHLNQLETIAYDLGVLTAIATSKSYTRESFLSRIESPIWNHGLSGSFRFNNAAMEREYSIIERDGNNIKPHS